MRVDFSDRATHFPFERSGYLDSTIDPRLVKITVSFHFPDKFLYGLGYCFRSFFVLVW